MLDRPARKLPKLPELTKLQALLLLGGAFVLAAVIWTVTQYRLVSVPDWGPYDEASGLITLYGDASSTKTFIQRMTASSSDTVPVAALDRASVTSLYLAPDQESGQLKVHATGNEPGHLRLIPKATQGVGFVVIDGRKEPVSASFTQKNAVFQVGRTYRGIYRDGPAMNMGRRMITSLNNELFYLEKPEGASWKGVSSLLGAEMGRFPALSAFWTLPGRVELTVSASGTDAALQPFSLYYRPSGSLAFPREMLETYVKNLLSDAVPHPIDVKLPDGSHMQELRHDPGGIESSPRQNQFGEITKYTVPGEKGSLTGFYTKAREAWLTTDPVLLQAIFLGNIGAVAANDACHKGGAGGFAMIPGSFLPMTGAFKDVTISIHNLETGLFTICGYY